MLISLRMDKIILFDSIGFLESGVLHLYFVSSRSISRAISRGRARAPKKEADGQHKVLLGKQNGNSPLQKMADRVKLNLTTTPSLSPEVFIELTIAQRGAHETEERVSRGVVGLFVDTGKFF